MVPRKGCLLLLAVFVLTSAKAANKPPEKGNRKANRLLNRNKPVLGLPNVTQCLDKQTYLVDNILYTCFHYGTGGPIKALVPMACATSSDLSYKRVNLNNVYKDAHFAYKCVRAKNVFKFVPITCMYGNIEIPSGQTLKTDNHEFHCIRGSQGNMSIVLKRYMHNLCSLGGRNASLVEHDNCPGMTKTIIHSSFGAGSAVRYNSHQNVLLHELPKKG